MYFWVYFEIVFSLCAFGVAIRDTRWWPTIVKACEVFSSRNRLVVKRGSKIEHSTSNISLGKDSYAEERLAEVMRSSDYNIHLKLAEEKISNPHAALQLKNLGSDETEIASQITA